ncbi:DUF167 domain-containing protein [Pseudodesulfovibrio sp. JC047]|uniref:DUF167 domain-containing protein n=1 Tax=Pseudodesulfovibrio sp. JC047 TaxID=2683199 RepID=UPI0013D45F06|nr:DUF167 domain-containing protein [Pseudodesulfovibrio sp. JC047]NDV19795.1 DUF167 domain-containing protein [Pseudodesulfovibrio sp. JC047]
MGVPSRPECVRWYKDCWHIAVWVQPGARKSQLAGEYQGCVKIRLNAPAVDNKANKSLVRYVAELLKVKKSQVAIVSGHTNRKKLLALSSTGEPDWSNLFPDSSPR